MARTRKSRTRSRGLGAMTTTTAPLTPQQRVLLTTDPVAYQKAVEAQEADARYRTSVYEQAVQAEALYNARIAEEAAAKRAVESASVGLDEGQRAAAREVYYKAQKEKAIAEQNAIAAKRRAAFTAREAREKAITDLRKSIKSARKKMREAENEMVREGYVAALEQAREELSQLYQYGRPIGTRYTPPTGTQEEIDAARGYRLLPPIARPLEIKNRQRAADLYRAAEGSLDSAQGTGDCRLALRSFIVGRFNKGRADFMIDPDLQKRGASRGLGPVEDRVIRKERQAYERVVAACQLTNAPRAVAKKNVELARAAYGLMRGGGKMTDKEKKVRESAAIREISQFLPD